MSRKKGFSIGAAMKERMNQNESAAPGGTAELIGPQVASAPAPVDMTPPVPEADLPPAAAPAPSSNPVTADPGSDPLESFNTRLPRSLHRRLKVHVALKGQKIQDVMHQALDEYLTRHGS